MAHMLSTIALQGSGGTFKNASLGMLLALAAIALAHRRRRDSAVMGRRRLIPAIVLALTAGFAHATTLMQENFDDLVAKAEGILVGTVVAREARRGPDNEIYTFTTLAQLEPLKGSYDQGSITLRQQGGNVGNEHLVLHGSPQFRTGERVLLFVRGNGSHLVPFVGWTQGVFRFITDADGRTVVADHDGNRLFRVAGATLQKESRYAPEAEILDRAGHRVTSGAPSLDAGTSEAGRSALRAPAAGSNFGTQAPMSPDEFVAAVRARVLSTATLPASAAPLRTVDAFEGIGSGPRTSAAARFGTAPSSPEATGSMSEPQLPRRQPTPADSSSDTRR